MKPDRGNGRFCTSEGRDAANWSDCSSPIRWQTEIRYPPSTATRESGVECSLIRLWYKITPGCPRGLLFPIVSYACCAFGLSFLFCQACCQRVVFEDSTSSVRYVTLSLYPEC